MVRGFSLIELIVVTTILVVLLLVASNFLITVLQQNNEISISNEVRNEVNRLMDQITTDLRSSKCEVIGSANNNSTLSLFDASDCTSAGAVPFAIYRVDSSSDLNLTKNTSTLNSNSVKIRSCTTCACTSQSAGFVVSETAVGSRVYNISLSLTQARDNPRADFCGKITTQKTISPRNRN